MVVEVVGSPLLRECQKDKKDQERIVAVEAI
jgi:hypothetical protein